MNICLQPILFYDAIAVLYLLLYLLSCTLSLSNQSVMQLQRVSTILSCTWYWFILSRIWLIMLILHVICDAWLHRRRCSLVSTASHRWHVSVYWYSCADRVSAVGRRFLQQFAVITSLKTFPFYFFHYYAVLPLKFFLYFWYVSWF